MNIEKYKFDYNEITDRDIDKDIFKYIENHVHEIYFDGDSGYCDNLVFDDDLIYFMRKFKDGKLMNVDESLFNKYIDYVNKLFIKMNSELENRTEDGEWSIYTSVPKYISFSNFHEIKYVPNLAYVNRSISNIYYIYKESNLKTDVVMDEKVKTIEDIYRKLFKFIILHSQNDYIDKISVKLDNVSQFILLDKLVKRNNEKYGLSLIVEKCYCDWNDILSFSEGIINERFVNEYAKIMENNYINNIGIMIDIFKNYVLKNNRYTNFRVYLLGVKLGIIFKKKYYIIINKFNEHNTNRIVNEYIDRGFNKYRFVVIKYGNFGLINMNTFDIVGLNYLIMNS